jgi:diguanylate cyclase (GGDEF)-like protein
MKRMGKNEIYSRMEIIGSYIEKYRLMIIVGQFIFFIFNLFSVIYWNFDNESAGVIEDYVYLFAYIFATVMTAAIIIILFLNVKKIVSKYMLVIVSHIYAFVLMAWATTICVLDIRAFGLPPILFLMISALIAGLFVIETRFYFTISFSSLAVVLIFTFITINNASADIDSASKRFIIENVVNIVVFICITSVISFRHYRVTIREYKSQKKLEELSYQDELTGLLNERSYLNEIDEINANINNNPNFKFGVVLMDVNNLKATNDKYGHRYGCHLIVRCGHKLPEIFKSSKLYHVGGDEFIVIVYGEDLEKFEDVIKLYDENMTYSIINHEGVDLIFSVARGYAIRSDEKNFRDVLQKADNAMYENKVMLKEKYNMKSR